MIATVHEWRFTILLGTLLASILIGPVALEDISQAAPLAASLVALVASIALCLAAIFAVGGRRGVLVVALVLVIPVVAFDLAGVFFLLGPVSLIRHGVRVLFFGLVIVALLRHLFKTRHITFDAISASLCVYLVLGALWANVFTIIEASAPGAIVDLGRPGAFDDAEIRSARMLYFSYVTLSSVGYGDIVPRGTLARMCAVIEAMMGQGYLLVMVSRLVSIQLSQHMPLPTPGPGARDTEVRRSCEGD
jgi:hypothetical protein